MMDKARTQPSYKILNRIIQVVKSIFTDNSAQEEGGDDTGRKDKDGKPITTDQDRKQRS